MEVSLSHQMAISSEEEEEDEEENLTGDAAGEFWMATAGAPRDDEQGGEDVGAPQDGLGGDEEGGGNQGGGDATAAEGKQGRQRNFF